MINIVILAGGVGTRLAPISTPEKPKQFLDLLGTGKTLIQSTVERFNSLTKYVPDIDIRFWAICPKEYFHFFKEQELSNVRLIEEPEGKNTGPAIALATKTILEDNDGITVFAPADAWVEDPDMFCRDISKAVSLARDKREIVCLGIKPTHPSTLYGYIEYSAGDDHKILKFKEKPGKEDARLYVYLGTFIWNSGIFVCDPWYLQSKFAQYAYSIWYSLNNYSGCPKISFDYAIMEKVLGRVIPVEWNWSDLGSFEAINKVKEYIYGK